MQHITVLSCRKGDLTPLSSGSVSGLATHTTTLAPLPMPRVGAVYTHDGVPAFRVVGLVRLPRAGSLHGIDCPLLEALCDHKAGERLFDCVRPNGWTLAWITLSDKGAMGQRHDESGPLMARQIREALPLCHEQGFLIPDDAHRLRALVTDLALTHGYDLLLTSGGTGVGPRDITPETLLPLFEKRLPGFEQAMMQASLAVTPRAAISRAVAGTLGTSLIISLPGSRKAVAENLAAVVPALAHTLEKLHGDPVDCGLL